MDGAKSDRATDGQSNEAKSDVATEWRSDGVTEIRSDGANKRRSDRKTKRRSNKAKILRWLNYYRKIDDSSDLVLGFSYAPTVGVLAKNQEEGEGCGVPGGALDGVEFRWWWNCSLEFRWFWLFRTDEKEVK